MARPLEHKLPVVNEMKITSIDSTIVNINRSRDLATAYGVSTATNTVVVQVRTDEGITGIGQTVSPGAWGGDTVDTIKHHIDDLLASGAAGARPLQHRRHASAHVPSASGGYQRQRPPSISHSGTSRGGRSAYLFTNCSAAQVMPGAVCHGFVEREEPAAMAARIEEMTAADGWTWYKTKIGFSGR